MAYLSTRHPSHSSRRRRRPSTSLLPFSSRPLTHSHSQQTTTHTHLSLSRTERLAWHDSNLFSLSRFPRMCFLLPVAGIFRLLFASSSLALFLPPPPSVTEHKTTHSPPEKTSPEGAESADESPASPDRQLRLPPSLQQNRRQLIKETTKGEEPLRWWRNTSTAAADAPAPGLPCCCRSTPLPPWDPLRKRVRCVSSEAETGKTSRRKRGGEICSTASHDAFTEETSAAEGSRQQE